jgi:hypothetical protein
MHNRVTMQVLVLTATRLYKGGSLRINDPCCADHCWPCQHFLSNTQSHSRVLRMHPAHGSTAGGWSDRCSSPRAQETAIQYASHCWLLPVTPSPDTRISQHMLSHLAVTYLQHHRQLLHDLQAQHNIYCQHGSVEAWHSIASLSSMCNKTNNNAK